MKIGIGYDVHRLVEGRRLFLGGMEIPFHKGLLGHSDGDVLIHAIVTHCSVLCRKGISVSISPTVIWVSGT
jgi:2-C-methyl-D-erythritol 2,4-cyclodiphosphate synthase